MALERADLTQLVSFDPPLPQVAFAVLNQGTTTSSETWGGSGTNGQTYSWFLLDTSWWVAAAGQAVDLNLLPIPVGTKFQVWTANTGAFDPANSLMNPEGATDLIDMNQFNATITIADPTVRYAVGVRQAAADGSSWYVYFGPSTDLQFASSISGIVTLPEPRNPVWLGTTGHVSGLSLEWSKPGGPTSAQFNVTTPANERPAAFNCGRRLQAFRGGSCIWDGILQEPVPSAAGWTLTADGVGTEGANYAAFYTTWNTDNPVDEAIGRGLRWRNDGIGSPPGIFGLTSANVQDSGSLTVQDFMNLLTTSGALYWSIEPPLSVGIPAEPWVVRMRQYPTDISGNVLSAGVSTPEQWTIQEWQRIDLKATLTRVPPDLYIVNTTPTGRTLNGTYNTLVCYYQATPDIPGASTTAAVAATYNTIYVDQPSAVAEQGRNEYYLDMSSNGVMSASQVVQVGQNILQKYIRLSFSTAYNVQINQLLNNGGEPVDLALDYSGKVATVLVSNDPVGGDVTFGLLTFFIADYVYNDDSGTGTITPYQNAGTDIQSLIAEIYPNGFN